MSKSKGSSTTALILGIIIGGGFAWISISILVSLISDNYVIDELNDIANLDGITILGLKGSIGDSFGVVNSLFSALAFCAVAISLYLQRREIKYALDANEKTSTIMYEQIKLSIKNSAVSTKIQLLELEEELINNANTKAKNREYDIKRQQLEEYLDFLNRILDDK